MQPTINMKRVEEHMKKLDTAATEIKPVFRRFGIRSGLPRMRSITIRELSQINVIDTDFTIDGRSSGMSEFMAEAASLTRGLQETTSK